MPLLIINTIVARARYLHGGEPAYRLRAVVILPPLRNGKRLLLPEITAKLIR
jgi:hypothetical protein